MEKSTKILIGVGVVGVVGLLIYNKAKGATPAKKAGGVIKNPSTTTPTNKPIETQPDNPIIDPINGKLVPPKPTTPQKPLPSQKDTTNPNTNPQFDMNKGIGSGGGGSTPSGGSGGGGGSPLVNDPDLSSGRMKKYDPNAKDENWIKALQKKQKAGNQSTNKKNQKQKETPKVDCYTNPYDPTCQKVKDCYYNPNDPSCSEGEYDYSYDYNNTYDYEGYDNNKYGYDYGTYDYSGGYDYVGGYDYSGGGYTYSGGGYNYSGGGYYGGNYGYGYSGGGFYDYDYNYFGSDIGGGVGRGGNPSDFASYWS